MYSHLRELEERVEFYEKAVASETSIEAHYNERMRYCIQQREFKKAQFAEERRDKATKERERRMNDLKRSMDLLRDELARREREREVREANARRSRYRTYTPSPDPILDTWECHICLLILEDGDVHELDGKKICYTCKYEPEGDKCFHCQCEVPRAKGRYPPYYDRVYPTLCKWCKYDLIAEQNKHEQNERVRRAQMLSRYDTFHFWNKKVNSLIQERKIAAFPFIPAMFRTCCERDCATAKSSELGICVHDLKACFEAGPSGMDELKKAYRNFHPDRFTNCCVQQFKETGRTLSEEMFKLIGQALGR